MELKNYLIEGFYPARLNEHTLLRPWIKRKNPKDWNISFHYEKFSEALHDFGQRTERTIGENESGEPEWMTITKVSTGRVLRKWKR